MLTAAVATVGSSMPLQKPNAHVDLYSDGVVLDRAGMPVLVPVGDPPAEDPDRRAAQDRWLADGRIPGPDRYADLATQALRDLDALVLPNGAALAAGSPAWRYVWPRDASFTAAALARTGHVQDAHAVLAHLARLQERKSSGGVLEARYLPDGTGAVPDQRGLQLDGNGWVLWGVAEWYAAAEPGPRRQADLETLRPLVERSVRAIRLNTDPVTGLPEVSPDYWEVEESVPTLGTVSALLAGVRAAGPVLAALGEPGVDDLEALLQRGVDEGFAPGYPRRLGGSEVDAAIAFLMPPFAETDPGVHAVWLDAAVRMRRPAGGLAPGEGWRQDGISWTPETAAFALAAAASGDVPRATAWLDWLDTHRTPLGALPEKVLWDGSPAAVAPLAWTGSLVLLTLDELDRQAVASGMR